MDVLIQLLFFAVTVITSAIMYITKSRRSVIITETTGDQRSRNPESVSTQLDVDVSKTSAVFPEENRSKSSTVTVNDRKVEVVQTVVSDEERVVPVSVNYHFTRQCNYKCGFCFHTAKTSFVLPLEDAKRGLKLLKEAGMQKINFSGGEPFIVRKGSFLGEMAKYCKTDLGLPSVTIVSNGSLIKQSWFEKYGEYVDILAVSCDSFDPDTNEKIGRQQGQKNHLQSLRTVRELCMDHKVAFKLNTVVNTYNKDEDMTEEIRQLNPCRWKVFQCLVIDGENAGAEALRNAETFVISDAEFESFLGRHRSLECLVPESNEKMQNSYLILDEYMRFLDCTGGSKAPSKSVLDVGVDYTLLFSGFDEKMFPNHATYTLLDIKDNMRFLDCTSGSKAPSKSVLDVGVNNALLFSGFDEKMFLKRGGKYTWSKADMKLDW